MKIRVFLVAAALAAQGVARLPAATTLMPLADVKAGMTGTGRTVFQGSDLQDFTVHILGVLKNAQGPKRNLILAKLEGGPLADTGVIAGMSGSPVYIDGRLVGAVSYSIGSFAKEPIAGITPIEEMIDATASASPRPAIPQKPIELPITSEQLTAALRASYTRAAAFASRPADVESVGFPQAAGSEIGALLRPIATPLLMSGLDRDAADLVSSIFGEAGFAPMLAGSAGGGAPDAETPLRPGDPIGVLLLGGDGELGATGTITHIDGHRVYAFGHPFFDVGPSSFPLTRAHVFTSLPSLMSSFKIATMGQVIGTMQQDRATAIAGTLGVAPPTIPVTVTLDSAGTPARTFHYEIANDQLFSPLLAYVSIFNTLGNYERQFGDVTFAIKGTAAFDHAASLSFDDIFTGDNAIANASGAIAGPLTLLVGNNLEPITVKNIDLTITASEESRSAAIERVWIDDLHPRAGQTVPIKVLTRSYRGAEKVSTVPIQIPANASGEITVMVTDGKALNQLEQHDLGRTLQPQHLSDLVRALNETRHNNRIYVRLLAGTPGAVVNGEALTSLPPSVMAVLEGDGSSGDFTPIHTAPIGDWDLQMDSAISGTRVLTIDLDAHGGSR
ncbi:MAG: SpoIVB peptidase S55 domain-containing protein [Vicinamibacterales bacterium]